MMRPVAFQMILLAELSACGSSATVQCDQSSTCDLYSGGICNAAGNGDHWCAYPDPSCPSGYRYSNFQTGDGLSAVCVLFNLDAGVASDGSAGCRRSVVFSDGLQGKGEIWVSNTDGSGAINLSNNAADDINPTWAPNGLRVAFQSNRTGNWDIFAVNADGEGLVNLTEGSTVDDYNPVWSPDGTRIAFVRVSSVSPIKPTVWVMNANGTGAAQVSTLTFTSDLAWSPTGDKLVFGFYDPDVPPQAKVPLLYVADVGDGASPMKLTSQTRLGEGSASWAPSKKIGFDIGADVLMDDESGANLVNVTQGIGHNIAPHIAASGNVIVFTSDRDNGHQEIWSIDAEGGSTTQLTHNTAAEGADLATDISADGVLVAYTHQIDANRVQVGVITTDGTANHTFNAPGGSNARGIRFSACR